MLVHFAQLAVLGRLLSPHDFGLMAMLTIAIEIARVFSQMGLSEAIISKQHTTRHQLSSLYWTNVAAGLTLYIALALASPLVAAMFGEPELAKMLPIVALIFILAAFSIQFEAMLRKGLHFDLFAKVNIASVLLNLVVSVALALHGFGVWSLIYGHIALQFFKTVLLVVVGARKQWLPEMHFAFDEIKQHLYFGLNRVGAMLANQVNSRVDQIAIGSLLGPVLLGYYNVAYRISLQPIQTVNPILTQVAFPVFSRIKDDNIRLIRGFTKMIHLLMSINAPLLIGLSVLAPLAIPLLMGEQWSSAVPIVQVLAFYALLRGLGNAGGSLMMAKGMANWTLYWNFALLFLIPASVVLTVFLQGSVLAVSLVLVCLQTVLLFIHYYVFLRRLLGPFLSSYVAAIGRPVLSAACMGVIVHYFQATLARVNDTLVLGLSVALGAVVYFAISFLLQPMIFSEYWQILPERLRNTLLKLFRPVLAS